MIGIPSNNKMSILSTDTEKIICLDELRKMKRKEEKTRPLSVLPLPKPLFERQMTDCGDSRYLERHPEAPDNLKAILMNMVRERSSSQGDTDLLARKRFPR